MRAARFAFCALLIWLSAPDLRAQRLGMSSTLRWDVYAFGDARAVRADPAGRLYVADAAGTVVVLSPAGLLLQTVSGNNRAPLRAPEDLDPTNGLLLLVADPGAGRIHRFGEGGIALESLGEQDAPRLGRFGDTAPEETFMPVAVAADARGNAFALDGATGRLLRWDLSRQRTILSSPDDGVLADPRALVVADERLFVLDRHVVVQFDAFGTPGRRFAARHAPEAVRIRQAGEGLALVLPQALALYNLEGGYIGLLSWDGPPLRDVAFSEGVLYLLTARALYRVM